MLLNKYISRFPTFLSTLRQFNIAMEHGPFICIYIYTIICVSFPLIYLPKMVVVQFAILISPKAMLGFPLLLCYIIATLLGTFIVESYWDYLGGYYPLVI
jgi:hypothetical protein